MIGCDLIVGEGFRCRNGYEIIETSSDLYDLPTGGADVLWPANDKLKAVPRMEAVPPFKQPCCHLANIPPNKSYVGFSSCSWPYQPGGIPEMSVEMWPEIALSEACLGTKSHTEFLKERPHRSVWDYASRVPSPELPRRSRKNA